MLNITFRLNSKCTGRARLAICAFEETTSSCVAMLVCFCFDGFFFLGAIGGFVLRFDFINCFDAVGVRGIRFVRVGVKEVDFDLDVSFDFEPFHFTASFLPLVSAPVRVRRYDRSFMMKRKGRDGRK